MHGRDPTAESVCIAGVAWLSESPGPQWPLKTSLGRRVSNVSRALHIASNRLIDNGDSDTDRPCIFVDHWTVDPGSAVRVVVVHRDRASIIRYAHQLPPHRVAGVARAVIGADRPGNHRDSDPGRDKGWSEPPHRSKPPHRADHPRQVRRARRQPAHSSRHSGYRCASHQYRSAGFCFARASLRCESPGVGGRRADHMAARWSPAGLSNEHSQHPEPRLRHDPDLSRRHSVTRASQSNGSAP